MLSSEDFLQIELLLEEGLITSEQLEFAQRYKKKLERLNIRKSLLSVLVDKGDLSYEQKQKILRIMLARQNRVPARLGGYKIQEKIGEGGMASVYRAFQISMGRVVALKILHNQFAKNKEYIQRFFREAQAVGMLNHPNIIQGIDVGYEDGFYYFSMEYVEGKNLKEVLEERRFEEREAVEIVLQIAKALEHANRYNILHRDIKPQNIFLTEGRVAKLGDLGLAKPKGDGSITKGSMLIGTPYYISPEQISDPEGIDIRSDIYSLGVTFYEMLTGYLPYSSESSIVAMGRRFSDGLPPIREYKADLSQSVVEIVERMTRIRPEERYLTPAELIGDLERYLAGEFVVERGKVSFSGGEGVLQRKRVMVVDDSRIFREVLRGLLENHGFEVVLAGDGREALDILERSRPDLILLDVKMPKMDGLEFAKVKQRVAPEIPVIFLTSEDSEDVEIEGLELGAEDYLVKPVQERRLLARVKKSLRLGKFG